MCQSTMSRLLVPSDYDHKNNVSCQLGNAFLVSIGKHVICTWIPSHIGIHWYTVVDHEAKDALDDTISNCSIPYTDFKAFIMKYIFYINLRHLSIK
jgi:hypothetical protein